MMTGVDAGSSSSTIRLAIQGAAGRMGRRLVALASADPAFLLVSAVEARRHPDLGCDAGQLAGTGLLDLPLSDQLGNSPRVVIDFSVPAAVTAGVRQCLEQRIALVLGTTGLDAAQGDEVRRAAEHIPIVWSPSMSMAVNLGLKLVESAGTVLRQLSSGADVEIIERHHRFKEDAPSGTALRFGEVISQAMGQTHHLHGRHGRPGKRPHHEIGYHAVRAGDNPGEHTIIFGMLGESIELTVRATSRDSYALGALQAAKYIISCPPGLYSMFDVLGL